MSTGSESRTQGILVEYDPRWIEEFTELRKVYERKLGALALSIEHVGSTAIPGIKAKPIIDIDIVISSYETFPAVSRGLAELGYRHNGDQGIPEREAFKRADSCTPTTDDGRQWTAHHLYVCPKSSRELKRHLAFRDFLRTNPSKRDEYESVKCEIAALSDGDRKRYAAIKEERCREFVEGILKLAP